MQKQAIKLLVFLLGVGVAMAMLCAMLYRFDNKYTYPGDTGLNGITILEENSLNASPVVFLVRGWEFYQHKLLSPEDFAANTPAPDAYVFIGQYGGFELGDSSADPHGNATYRIRVALPETPRSYALELPEVYSSCRVYVNGVLLAQRGNPDSENYRPEIKTGVLTFWGGGQTEIIVAASDYSHFYSGLVYPPAFGLPEAVSAMVGRRLILRAVFCFVALLAGLIFIFDGFRSKKTLTAGYGFTCLFFMGYICYPIIHAIGLAGPILWYRIENVCYFLTFLMALIIQNSLCGVPRPVSRLSCLYGFGICLSAVFAGVFAKSLDGIMLYFYMIRAYKLFLIIYLFAATIYAAIKKAINPQLQLAGIIAFGVSLLMNRLFPMYEPISAGWFPELGGAVLVACLGITICVKSAHSQSEMLALHGQMDWMQKRMSHADKQLLLQQGRLESMRNDIVETRRSKHDMRHHISLLHGLLHTDPKKAMAYLEELNAAQPAAEDSLCKNLAVDCVVRQYAAASKLDGIIFEAAVDLPEEPGVSAIDLCIVFSNLLENAFEALRGEKEGNRVIRVTAGTTGKMLAINVDNSLRKPLHYRRGVLLSGKRDAPGVGLSSVRSVAEKYKGEFEWRDVDGMFRASVVLIAEEQVVMQHEDSCM